MMIKSLYAVVLGFISMYAQAQTTLPASVKRCAVLQSTCTDPNRTIVIDGYEVTQPCWAQTIDFICIMPPTLDTCAAPRARGCTETTRVCNQTITINGVRECINEAVEFTCIDKPSVPTEDEVDCKTRTDSIDGYKYDTGHANDKDFKRVITAFEIGREAGTYLDQNNFTIFKGKDERCSKNLIKQCCKKGGVRAGGPPSFSNFTVGKGLGIDGSKYVFDSLGFDRNSLSEKFKATWGFYGVGGALATGDPQVILDPVGFSMQVITASVTEMLACTEDEKKLSIKRDKRLCVYVGDYCSKKLPIIGVCLERKESYCCYNGRLARIVAEQGKPQLGRTFGSADKPDCTGFTIADFARLDFSKINFAEFYDEIQFDMPDYGELSKGANTKIQNYFGEKENGK